MAAKNLNKTSVESVELGKTLDLEVLCDPSPRDRVKCCWLVGMGRHIRGVNFLALERPTYQILAS